MAIPLEAAGGRLTLHPQPLLDVHASIEFEDGSYAEGHFRRMHWPETGCLEAHTAYGLFWLLDCCFFQPEGSRERKKANCPDLAVRGMGRAAAYLEAKKVR